jgi:carboxymethylenebutenolidase
MGKTVSFQTTTGDADGYLAESTAGGPGLVLLQEYWGLVPHIKQVADRLAAAGFTTIAPDLYHGEIATEPDAARRQMMALSMDRAAGDLEGAVDLLAGRPGVAADAVGVVGFCLGGGLALFLASHDRRVRATVDFYGVLPIPGAEPELSTVRGAFQGHFGAHDAYISNDARVDLRTRLDAAGVGTELFVYDAGHAFFNDTREDAFEPAAAELAWARTLRFLRDRLTGG